MLVAVAVAVAVMAITVVVAVAVAEEVEADSEVVAVAVAVSVVVMEFGRLAIGYAQCVADITSRTGLLAINSHVITQPKTICFRQDETMFDVLILH
jgi:hypothetical protein